MKEREREGTSSRSRLSSARVACFASRVCVRVFGAIRRRVRNAQAYTAAASSGEHGGRPSSGNGNVGGRPGGLIQRSVLRLLYPTSFSPAAAVAYLGKFQMWASRPRGTDRYAKPALDSATALMLLPLQPTSPPLRRRGLRYNGRAVRNRNGNKKDRGAQS